MVAIGGRRGGGVGAGRPIQGQEDAGPAAGGVVAPTSIKKVTTNSTNYTNKGRAAVIRVIRAIRG